MFLITKFMPISYLFGNFFTTPIALILFKIFNPNQSTSLIYIRITDIIIGTCIGSLGLLVFEYVQSRVDKKSVE